MYKSFHTMAVAEGLSFLFLLGIAMPMKYVWGYPGFVTYAGWVHGVLFIAYVIWSMVLFLDGGWNLRKTLRALLLAFVPFGWKWL